MRQHQRSVVLLHGWSDDSRAFEPLAGRLAQTGRSVVPLWLGDYLSLDDDVTLPDIAQRLEAVLQEKVAAGLLQLPMDFIVHSTGALVARQWLASHERLRVLGGQPRWLQRRCRVGRAAARVVRAGGQQRGCSQYRGGGFHVFSGQ